MLLVLASNLTCSFCVLLADLRIGFLQYKSLDLFELFLTIGAKDLRDVLFESADLINGL